MTDRIAKIDAMESWTYGRPVSNSGGGRKSSREMTELYGRWIAEYPIVLIEDGLAENVRRVEKSLCSRAAPQTG